MISAQMEYITTFIWLYNIGAAFIILFLILQILLMSRKLDVNIIRARLFLNMYILRETWTCISIAGATFALNSFIGFMKFNTPIKTYYLWEITEIFFLGAFIAMIYQWYRFVGGLVDSEKIKKKCIS